MSVQDGLDGARVLVTGAAGGIGSAVTEAFVRAGALVFATDLGPISDSPARKTAQGDLRDTGTCRQLVQDAAGSLGGLDVVAHMAGLLRRRDALTDVTEADWDLQHDVNLKAAFFLLREAGQFMVDQGTGGRLIAATSQGWWTGGYGGSVAYAAAKGGLVSLCRGLARTYGPAAITVNTVAPGAIDTPMLRTDLRPETLTDIIGDTPLRRLGTAAEVADAVLFLASDRARFISAATLNISGGWLAY